MDGEPCAACFLTPFPTSWAPDHLKISATFGIGGRIAIDDSKEQIAERGYPDIGVVVCATPSAGHDPVMLDYSGCSPRGEPAVAYVDDDRIPRRLAETLAEFLDGLRPCEEC